LVSRRAKDLPVFTAKCGDYACQPSLEQRHHLPADAIKEVGPRRWAFFMRRRGGFQAPLAIKHGALQFPYLDGRAMVAINGSIKVDQFTLAELMEVKRFVDFVGSIEEAREVLLALANESNN
jgi:hypothetical protein